MRATAFIDLAATPAAFDGVMVAAMMLPGWLRYLILFGLTIVVWFVLVGVFVFLMVGW